MNNYLISFRKLAKELYENPNVVLLEYKEFQPITEEKIKKVESKLGFKLPENIASFYKISNGLRLSWIHKKDKFYDEDEHYPFDPTDFFDTNEFPNDLTNNELFRLPASRRIDFSPASQHESGSIHICALEDVFTEPFEMNEELIDEGKFVFDAPSSIKGAAIYFDKNNEANIVLCEDHYADFETDIKDMTMSFDEYINLLIETKGIKSFRANKKEIKKLKKILTPEIKIWPKDFYYSEN